MHSIQPSTSAAGFPAFGQNNSVPRTYWPKTQILHHANRITCLMSNCLSRLLAKTIANLNDAQEDKAEKNDVDGKG
jgi:hypothetical protein